MQDRPDDPSAPPGGVPPGIVIGGKFTLLRLIAEGGVGSVYEAEDALIGRRVALKLLRSHVARQAEVTRRFLREAQATASIDHPHVVTILEMGIQPDGNLFIVQELLRGKNLRQRLAAAGRVDADEALQIALPIADALAAAHRRGVVHRDIKPDNIVLSRNSSSELVPKLIDFGVAKMRSPEGKSFTTLTGTLLGTTAYMSPEQARGDATIDGRADVWGLAAVLFEALSGQCPYDGPTEHAILVKILTATGPPPWPDDAPEVPPDLLEIIRAGLERDVDRRPTMVEMRDRLRACVEARGHALTGLRAEPADAIADPPSDAAALDDILELSPEHVIADGDEPVKRGVPTRIWTPAAHSIPSVLHTSDAAPPAPPSGELSLRPDRRRSAVEQLVALAEDALRINALDDAITRADEAIAQSGGDAVIEGRLRLTQSIASYWLGRYGDAEAKAIAAMGKLERGTTGWYAAVGHVAMAAGHRGDGARLDDLTRELLATGADHPGRDVATCRLVVQLARAGAPDRARDLLATVDEIDVARSAEPFVRAWYAAARAELAVIDGDPMRYLELVKESVDDFVAAGDIRNASLQRSNIGNAFLQLGSWRNAEKVLSEAVSTAEPMKLSFAAAARANLGIALARTGHIDHALAVETEAKAELARQGNRRFEAVSTLYLSMILAATGKAEQALSEARAAVEVARGIPGIRAYALAVLAHYLLDAGRTEEALSLANEARSLLDQQSGVEEGASLIRVVQATAAAQAGNPREAALRIREARSHLLERAGRISDLRWRDRFLRNVPENAQTLALAKLWADPG